MINKRELSGIIILFIGVALLTFTFLNAYWFLMQNLNLMATSDLINAFGEVLGPLIATCIRIMYLGVMGWIGSLLTLRGIQLLTQKEKKLAVSEETKKQNQTPQKQAVKQTVKAFPQVKEEKTKKIEETEKEQHAQKKTVEKPKQVESSQEPEKIEETKNKEEEEKKETSKEKVVHPVTHQDSSI